MNPAQFRIWTFRIHNHPLTLFPDCVAHLEVWCPSYQTIPLQGFFFSLDLMPVPLSLSEPSPNPLEWRSFRHTKSDFDCICPFRLDASWLAQPPGQDSDPDVLLSSHVESSSWTMTVCYTSRFLPDSHPRVATYSHSIKTRLSNFLVCGSQLCST